MAKSPVSSACFEQKTIGIAIGLDFCANRGERRPFPVFDEQERLAAQNNARQLTPFAAKLAGLRNLTFVAAEVYAAPKPR